MLCRTILTLLIASITISRLQNVLAGLIPNPSPAGGLKTKDSLTDFDSILRFYATLNDTTNSENTGANISWGSHDVQSGNVYSGNERGEVRYGSQDIQIGNIFPKNSYGTYVYGPILEQKNNVYHEKGEKVLYGASVTQIGNIYPKNPGNQDIYGPVVIQKDNIYPENSGNNTVFGAIVNQINNTYPKSVEGNKDALKPIIYQSGNVYPPTSNTNSVVGAVVKENGSRFHPSQGIQAKEIGERSAQLNKTRVDGVNSVIEASTIQKDNTFNTGPNDESIYGSIVKVKNKVYESPDSRQPTSTQTRTVIAPGGPGHDGVSYVKSEERDHQRQPEIRLNSTTKFPPIKDPSKGQLFSAYVPDDSSPSLQVETNAQDNKEKEAHAKKHSEPNGQTSLSPNVFFLFTYLLITLIKLNVLN